MLLSSRVEFSANVLTNILAFSVGLLWSVPSCPRIGGKDGSEKLREIHFARDQKERLFEEAVIVLEMCFTKEALAVEIMADERLRDLI